MLRQRLTNTSIFLILFALLSSATLAQKEDKEKLPQGKPVLWEAVNISEQNLLLGPGGEEMKPDLSNITFIEEEKGGWSKKYRIKDGAGRAWVAKVNVEAQPETAAVRLVWALGYKSEVNYLVPELTIPTVGTFKNVRLEARPKEVTRTVEWDWKKNPFVGTNELQGLKIMMALINNWDIKNSNNKVLLDKEDGGREVNYVISDLGESFGKIGNLPLFWRLQRKRNDPEAYEKTKFITSVKDGRLHFAYGGKMRELFDDITVEQGRWTLHLLSQLSDEQIRDAFRAANYSPDDVDTLLQEIKDRIAELSTVTSAQTDAKR